MSATSTHSQGSSGRYGRFMKVKDTLVHHVTKHIGVGIICAVAYFDPGNWSVDLQAGSQFGYKLLFVVLLSGLGAVVLQALACKLGCVTGLDLASHCRLLLNDHPTHPRLIRYAFLYPLYVLSEIAIISTDIAELLGSAIGLNLLIPALPLWAAVIITAFDVLFILAVGDPSKGANRPVRLFEFLIIALVAVVLVCFIVLVVKVSPSWGLVFKGYLPSKTLISPRGLYSSIGILGATVMPHALYLGSQLATQDRISTQPSTLPVLSQSGVSRSFKSTMKKLFFMSRASNVVLDVRDRETPYGDRENNTLKFVRGHLGHGVTDIVLSLLGFAVAINSAILILAGAVFFYGHSDMPIGSSAGLFDAHAIIRSTLGKAPAFIFALALICSGQSASITATLSGQIVSEGFINWHVSPFLRRLLTRLIGLVPSVAVAAAVGKDGIDSLLVITQVILSLVLPFVVFPLVWFTSSSLVMRVRKPPPEVSTVSDEAVATTTNPLVEGDTDENAIEAMVVGGSSGAHAIIEKNAEKNTLRTSINLQSEDAYIDYSNGWILTILGYAIWLFVMVANGYLIVTLALGQSG